MSATRAIPQVGLLAKLRNRRGVITAVEPFDTGSAGDGTVHAVRVEYTDSNGPQSEMVLWEQEPTGEVVAANRMPDVERLAPMQGDAFDAVVRTARWQALQPLIGSDGKPVAQQQAVAAPLFGAVQAEDFQIEPLLRALQMPRVSLLIADDVGLGKTVEAGLILSELLLRRRIRRVLVLCPASLKQQWQQELDDKFALHVDVVDRKETHALQRGLGLDANPWRSFGRIVSSYHYLRQPDVLEQFLATCRTGDGTATSAQLPWDLLIVDEAHNLMPAAFGTDSALTEMLRQITPYFEHKLFLTATPHNGHTQCFSGLLELLDPIRFNKTDTLSVAAKTQIGEVVIRRLKRDINAMDVRNGKQPRFANRLLSKLDLRLSSAEQQLSVAFAAFRRAVKSAIAASQRGEQLAGSFAVEVLNKRLLSTPTTFAHSWWRFQAGLRDPQQTASAADAVSAGNAVREEQEDDREREGRTALAAQIIGAWLRPLAPLLVKQIVAVDEALNRLGLSDRPGEIGRPSHDSRLVALFAWLDSHLRHGNQWRQDERLIVFTEYKTTLDYLQRAIADHYGSGLWLDVLYGGMEPAARTAVRVAFNDPAAAIRVLVATDTASEGLNLQETARYLLHWDIPWNPSRLEQRNGRLDRHGQARDVTVLHFASEDDADLKFLAHVINKVQEIREDLGAMGEVFEAAFERRFQDQFDAAQLTATLDRQVAERRLVLADALAVANEPQAQHCDEAVAATQDLRRDADLAPTAMAKTTALAMGGRAGEHNLQGPDSNQYFRLVNVLPAWRDVVDEALRIKEGANKDSLPRIAFDPAACMQRMGERLVFRIPVHVRLLHLGHPVLRHTIQHFSRARFRASLPNSGEAAGDFTGWTVRRQVLPAGVQALVLLTVEELAVNALREPVHHWVRTLRLPVQDAAVLAQLAWLPPSGEQLPAVEAGDSGTARDLWLDIEGSVSAVQRKHALDLTAAIQGALADRRTTAQAHETQRYKERIAEVQRALSETSIAKLQRELDKIQSQGRAAAQIPLLEDDRLAQQQRQAELASRERDIQEELDRRKSRYGELLALLHRERDRVLTKVIPLRHQMSGAVQVMTLAVEIRLPLEG